MTQNTLMSRLNEVLIKDGNILVAYLFGSYARGRAGPLSDIDVAVLLAAGFPAADYLTKQLALQAEIARHLKTDLVDLIILNQAPPLLAHRVLAGGRLIFTRDQRARAAFQVKTIQDYLDTKPLRRQQTSSLFARIKENRFAS